MPFSPQSIVHPQVLQGFVARSASGPTTDNLYICTGTAVFDFVSTTSNVALRDTLEFVVPDENGSPLIIEGTFFNALATAAPVSFETHGSDTALWAVDQVDTIKSGPSGNQISLNIAIAVMTGPAKQVHLERVAYQLAFQVGP